MLKSYKPTSAGQRHALIEGRVAERKVNAFRPKSLLVVRPRTGGRNHHGRITCRHRGGGHKKFIRVVDFFRKKEKVPARVMAIEYDPNRGARLALIYYADGEKAYILAPHNLAVGATVVSDDEGPVADGCCMRLKAMPIGSFIHNVEIQPGKGGKLVRAAGLSAQLMARSDGYATLKMPSGEMRMIPEEARATFGSVSNPDHNLRSEGKAGRSRWQGIRPTVRGTAMNPVDHPHGGGEGKHNGYLPQTPWAQYTKGFRTRSKKKNTWMIVKDRRK